VIPTATQERWQLTASTAEAYERYLVPRLFAPWAQRLVDLAAPQAAERVLDVACGTGVVARHAATWVGDTGAVVGLDPNHSMLEVARVAAADVSPPIHWRAGDAGALPFPDGDFDVVFCQQGVQFFPDRAEAFREMHRVLDPDGRLAVSVWRDLRHCPGYHAMTAALERHAGAEAAAVMRTPFSCGDAERLRELVTAAGFGQVRIGIGIGAVKFPSPESFLRQQAAASPLARPLQALAEDDWVALVRDLGEMLGSHADDGVVFPIEALVITARAARRRS
jgi:SAM-dependent methyltransferase